VARSQPDGTTEAAPPSAPPAPSAPSTAAAADSGADGPAAGTPAAAAGGEPAQRPDSAEVTVVPGITRYHRAGCILIRFLGAEDLETMTKQAAEEAGCVPCKACRPEQDLPEGAD
jgi:hypothetical protein